MFPEKMMVVFLRARISDGIIYEKKDVIFNESGIKFYGKPGKSDFWKVQINFNSRLFQRYTFFHLILNSILIQERELFI